MRKLPVSLCMVVRNDAETIGKAIDCVRDVVDEVLIIDQKSTDGTYEIVKEKADRVIVKRPKGYADPDRNYLYPLAKNDWILYLDADEYLDEELVKTIPSLLELGADVFWFKTLNVVDGVDIEELLGDDFHPRLFKKGKIAWRDGHMYPEIKSLFQGWCLNGRLVHNRTYEKIKRASDARMPVMDETSRKIENRFLKELKKLLNKNEKGSKTDESDTRT